MMCCSNDHKANLISEIRNENIIKIDKPYNYMFEGTLSAKRLCLNMFKLRDGFCVMVKY